MDDRLIIDAVFNPFKYLQTDSCIDLSSAFLATVARTDLAKFPIPPSAPGSFPPPMPMLPSMLRGLKGMDMGISGDVDDDDDGSNPLGPLLFSNELSMLMEFEVPPAGEDESEPAPVSENGDPFPFQNESKGDEDANDDDDDADPNKSIKLDSPPPKPAPAPAPSNKLPLPPPDSLINLP
jgi:hypothetical protein